MQADTQQQQLRATLAELEALQREEATALRRLSRDAVDDLTDRKLLLWEKLREQTQLARLEAEDRELLERVRRGALMNQILLHHARDAVRSILQAASGQSFAPTSSRSGAIQNGLRVDFRG